MSTPSSSPTSSRRRSLYWASVSALTPSNPELVASGSSGSNSSMGGLPSLEGGDPGRAHAGHALEVDLSDGHLAGAADEPLERALAAMPRLAPPVAHPAAGPPGRLASHPRPTRRHDGDHRHLAADRTLGRCVTRVPPDGDVDQPRHPRLEGGLACWRRCHRPFEFETTSVTGKIEGDRCGSQLIEQLEQRADDDRRDRLSTPIPCARAVGERPDCHACHHGHIPATMRTPRTTRVWPRR